MNKESIIFLYKLIAIPAFLLLIYVIVFFARFTVGESYNIFAPYADTRMAAGYSPDKFDAIKPGMHMMEVQSIIGKPLTDNFDTYTLSTKHEYTGDGKLLHKSSSFWIPEDLAWYYSEVYYNNDSAVVSILKGWRFD